MPSPLSTPKITIVRMLELLKKAAAMKNMRTIVMAGPVGIEPTLRVLETLVLPLYDGPIGAA